MEIKKIIVIVACALLGLATAMLLLSLLVASEGLQIATLVVYLLSLVSFIGLGVLKIVENSRK